MNPLFTRLKLKVRTFPSINTNLGLLLTLNVPRISLTYSVIEISLVHPARSVVL